MKRIFIATAILLLISTLFTSTTWAVLSQTEVSQLYIGIFGRASEGGGNSYWQTDPSSSSMTSTANVMLNTDPAKEYFGTNMNDNAAFVAHIYTQTLGKAYADDPAGQDYWVSQLVTGKSKGEMIAALISAAQHPANAGDAQNRFNYKVEVSNYCANKISVYTDLDSFVGFISGVTHYSSTRTAAKTKIDNYGKNDKNDDDGILDTSFLELKTPGTYEVESNLTYRDNVKTLTTQAGQNSKNIFLDEELGQIIISNPVMTYTVGDILILDDSSWKVTKVNIGGTTTTLTVQSANLDEIVKDGTLSFDLTPDWSSGQFEGDTSLLQKEAQAYFIPSPEYRSTYTLSESDVGSQGAINLDGTSLFEFITEYDASKGKMAVDWAGSTILGVHLGFETDPSCQGCCSSHGGVICHEGAPSCGDFEDLSLKCKAKKCNPCPPAVTVTKEGRIKGKITTGQIKIVPTMKGNYDLWEKTADCKMDMVVIFDATVEISSVGAVSFDFEKQLLPKIKVPVTIPTPAGPVLIDIELEMPVKVSLEASVSGVATFEYHSKYAIKLDMNYKKGTGTHTIKFDPISQKKDVSLSVEGSIEAKLSLVPRVTLKFYKVIGPFVELEPYIRGVLTKSYDGAVLDWKDKQDDLYLGVDLRGGLYIYALGRYKTPDINLIEKSWDLVKPDDNSNLYYLDQDGDGYGDPDSSYEDVSPPWGYVTDHTDCDDTDSSIHPEAQEICGDRIDQDCNGSDLVCETDPGDVETSGDFKLTQKSYYYKDSTNNACSSEFGSNSRMADWNDIVAYSNKGKSMNVFQSLSGGMVTKSNAPFYNSNRHYFITWHNHNLPGYYLSHANIDNHLIDLGSWNGNFKVLCYSEASDDNQPDDNDSSSEVSKVVLTSSTPQKTDMNFSYSGAAYDSNYKNHWRITSQNGYMQFTFSGKNDFNFHALGSTSSGVSYCYVDVYINGQRYWKNKFIDKDWTWYTIQSSQFGSGTNTVKIVLTGQTHAWIDEANTEDK